MMRVCRDLKSQPYQRRRASPPKNAARDAAAIAVFRDRTSESCRRRRALACPCARRPPLCLSLLPAVDVADGRRCGWCKAWSGPETTYGAPLEAALAWQDGGAQWVHLVDLDAAFGRGTNRELIAEVVGRLDVAVELSGEIRDDELADRCAGHRLRPGQPRHRRARTARLGARRDRAARRPDRGRARRPWHHAVGPRLDPRRRRAVRRPRPVRRGRLCPLRA